MSLQTLIKKMCPYVSNPASDCYCIKEGSQDIYNAVKYCSNNFERCFIYREKSEDYEKIITDN